LLQLILSNPELRWSPNYRFAEVNGNKRIKFIN